MGGEGDFDIDELEEGGDKGGGEILGELLLDVEVDETEGGGGGGPENKASDLKNLWTNFLFLVLENKCGIGPKIFEGLFSWFVAGGEMEVDALWKGVE